MAKDNDDSTWYRRSEDDDTGTYLGEERDDDAMQTWYLLHGGRIWRPPWTY